MSRINVVLTTEGTYPYEPGGVSVWADLLVHELKNIDYTLLPIMMHPFVKLKYNIPANVADIITVPLWGSEEPTEYIRHVNFAQIYLSKIKTGSSDRSIDKIVKVIDILMAHIFREENDMERVGEAIYDYYEYFHEFDYYETFRKQEVWEAYRAIYLKHYEGVTENIPTVYDMIEGLRYLYRFFISLLPEIPKAHIYHSSAAAFCGLPCIIAKKKYGAKFLLTEHGSYIREQYLYASREQVPVRTKEFLMGLITLVAKLNYHYADVIAPVCDYNKRWEIRWGAKEEKIHTIYNGIDSEIFKNYNLAANERPTVVMLARIDPLKDIETYIKTASLVAKEIPDVLFKLYGPEVNPEYAQQCKALVKELDIERNFEFAGLTNNPALAYNEGDVVMLTSISEAFPFVVIEAMACEKVVVSSDVGGTKEVLEGYGYVIKPKDYNAFSNAVVTVLKDRNMAREMGVEAREKILNGFTIEDMVDNYGAMYERLYYEVKDATTRAAVLNFA